MSKGYVYILCDDHSKHVVKIGKASKDVGRRVRTLQTGNPWIREFVTVQSSKWNEIEKFVHHVIKLIAHNKQVGTSEFFRIEPEVAKKILLEFKDILPESDFKIVEHKRAISRAKLGAVINAAKNRKYGGQLVFKDECCGAIAEGCIEKDHSFTVFRKSRISPEMKSGFKSMKLYKLYKDLKRNGIIVDGVFKKDYNFASPSAAAAICNLCSSNGNRTWKLDDGTMLGEMIAKR